MGAGIAQLACMAGYDTRLYDLDRTALERAIEVMRNGLRRGVERERWTEDDAAQALSRLKVDQSVELMKGCDVVIEAAPEDLELKRDLFHRLAGVCADRTVLATNTSSLSVTAIAAGVPYEERVVGMHFFNPPPLMRLVEIVAGDESGEGPLGIATEVAKRMGRRPIRARDGIGFVANRCVRPFNLEALRMLGEGVGSHEEIDRVYRLAGGFRMGPFELMDLIGIDVNFAVARSFYEQSFGEPRWRPHPIQARLVAARRLGRKARRGFYSYDDGPHRERDPEVEADRPILDHSQLAEVAGPKAPAIMDRLGATVVNEASFALADRVATPEDIDTAMMLGFNWPIGPVSWGNRLGHPRVVEILDDLRALHGESYRAAPSLRASAD